MTDISCKINIAYIFLINRKVTLLQSNNRWIVYIFMVATQVGMNLY